MSSVDLDGSHTPALRGGSQVAYQGRKKKKTTNALFLTDRQGIPIAKSDSISFKEFCNSMKFVLAFKSG